MTGEQAAEVLDAIVDCRRRFYACTGRMLADRCDVAHITMQRRLARLYTEGLVDWTDVVGSIVVTVAGYQRLHQVDA